MKYDTKTKEAYKHISILKRIRERRNESVNQKKGSMSFSLTPVLVMKSVTTIYLLEITGEMGRVN